MVRKKETAMTMRLPAQHRGLEVKIPSFFRCPISLDVMRSPVSLCTGVTYDRASIQRWLDSGNTTCPATMLPLRSTDLVPNLTLRSLIAHWAADAADRSPTAAAGGDTSSSASARTSSPASLVRQVASPTVDPAPALRQLAAYLSDDDVDDFEKNALLGAGRAAETVASVLRRRPEETAGVEGAEAAVRLLAAILASDGVDDANKKRVATALAADAAASAAALARVMRHGSGGLEARVDAARLAELLLADNAAADEAAKAAVAESSELLAELVRLVGTADEKGALDRTAVGAGLSCLAAGAAVWPHSQSRRAVWAARGEMVRLGAVRAAVRALRSGATATDPRASANALRVLESAVGCAEGRAALCGDAEDAVPAVVARMMKSGRDGAEAAVAVLWAVCHRYRDRRAADAAAAADGGLTRLLLMMQSGCSPAAKQMALDLLKIYRVNAKSCLAGYDSKTTHIMPF